MIEERNLDELQEALSGHADAQQVLKVFRGTSDQIISTELGKVLDQWAMDSDASAPEEAE